MGIEYIAELKRESDTTDLYTALEWYQLSGYTDADIAKANESFYSVYAYDNDTLIGLGRVASDGMTAAIMSGICVRPDYRKRGIGAEIVNKIVEYCQTGNYRMDVRLFCEESLIKWYTDLGFEKITGGMMKPKPVEEEHCALKKNFGEIYGIEQIADIAPDFRWFNFDSYGDFRYYSGIGSEGHKVPFINMVFYSNEPVKLSAEIIFENVSEFEIGCTGVRTPLMGFDIINTERFGYSEKKRYKIRSLEDDDINFFCEKFRIMLVKTYEGVAQLTSNAKPAEQRLEELEAAESAAYSDETAADLYTREIAEIQEIYAEDIEETASAHEPIELDELPVLSPLGEEEAEDDGYGASLLERLGLQLTEQLTELDK